MGKIVFIIFLCSFCYVKAQVCFDPAVNYSVGAGTPHPQRIISGDFNGDSKIDLVEGNLLPGDMSILLGDGLGGFGLATHFGNGFDPTAIISNDFDGDGKKDLVVGQNGSANIKILLGTGTGSFGTAVNYTVTNTPKAIVSSDFNADGILDLAVVTIGINGSINIRLGLG